MHQIKLVVITLLLASVWMFHVTMPQKQIVFIPAAGDVIKVRPIGHLAGMPLDSLDEAATLFVAKCGRTCLHHNFSAMSRAAGATTAFQKPTFGLQPTIWREKSAHKLSHHRLTQPHILQSSYGSQ